jgi:hypothetical protein
MGWYLDVYLHRFTDARNFEAHQDKPMFMVEAETIHAIIFFCTI